MNAPSKGTEIRIPMDTQITFAGFTAIRAEPEDAVILIDGEPVAFPRELAPNTIATSATPGAALVAQSER